MKIATWNINSVRLRLPLVLAYLKAHQPDILCLQETKTQDIHFPAEALAEAGWSHQAYRGEKSYNGVAILSRLPIADSGFKFWADKEDTRHIWADIQGVRVHNFYVPAGGDEPNREVNPKFGHKLDFLAEMTDYFSADTPQSSVLVGDLNIAPLAEDVWSTKQLRNVVSHTDIERELLLRAIEKGGWVDAMRTDAGAEAILYSWWSYRARDWQASNRGRRLDHIWISQDLAPNLSTTHIETEARGWEKPSDHVPMSVSLSL